MRSLLSGSVSAEPGTGNQVGVLADDGDESDESDEGGGGGGVGWENVLSSLFSHCFTAEVTLVPTFYDLFLFDSGVCLTKMGTLGSVLVAQEH